MKNVAAIIFDMDGTIVHTENIWRQASDVLLSQGALRLTVEDYEEFHAQAHGLAMRETCALIKKYANLSESVDELVVQKKHIVRSLYTQEIRFVAGFPEFHDKISCLNLKSGVATNADEQTLHTTNSAMNLSKFFGVHLYSIALVNNKCKPLPDIYLYVATQLGVEPHKCIAVEDSAHGIAAAQAAGMRCIGINTSGDQRQVQKADYIVNSYDMIDLDAIGENDA